MPEAASFPVQGDSTDATIVAKLNASEGSALQTLTHGYFSFAGNLLTGNLPAFLDSSQVPAVSKGLINLQVCTRLKYWDVEAAKSAIMPLPHHCEENPNQALHDITCGPEIVKDSLDKYSNVRIA